MTTEKNWWDGLLDIDIKRMKENIAPYGLLSDLAKQIFDSIPKSERHAVLEIYDYSSSLEWVKKVHSDYYPYTVYRLRPDWKRPESKKEDEYEWREYEIQENEYCVSARFTLKNHGTPLCCISAPFLVEYKEWPGKWFSLLNLFFLENDPDISFVVRDHEQYEVTKIKPATPVRIKIWCKKEIE